MRALILCALLAAASGCTDLPDFGKGCGNRVLDPGEDCDGEAGCDATCHLECADIACPGGYACGTDLVCHAPSGLFREGSAIPFQAEAVYAVTDVDADGYGDVVSVSQTALDTDFGGPAGAFKSHSSTLIPRALGVPTFADIDQDARLDVLIPTASGIAGYSSKYAVMSPHAFPIDLAKDQMCPGNVQLGQPFMVFALDDRFLGLMTTGGPIGNHMGFAVIDGAAKKACPWQPQVQICDATPSQDPTGNIGVLADVYDTTTPGNKAISVTLPGQGTCVFETTHDASDKFVVHQLTPSKLPISQRTALAAIKPGTTCPALLYADASLPMTIHQRLGAGTPGACTLGPEDVPTALSMPADTPPNSVPIGHLRLSPSPAGGTYPPDAVMLTYNAFTYDSTTAVHEVFRSDRPLDQVETADLNGDGALDAVAYKRGDTGLDMLMRTGDAFLPVRLETNALADLELGDFDGNQAADIAYVEVEASGLEQMFLAYGTRDRPLDPLPIGTFARVVGLVRIQLDDPSDPLSAVDDLMVFDLVDLSKHEPVMTVFKASPQRTLTAFLDPRTSQAATDVFTGVAAGNFFTDMPYTDLLGIATGGSSAAAWQFRGTAAGVVEFPSRAPNSTISKLALCNRGGPSPTFLGTGFCTDNARYVTWPSATQGHDVVIAIENPLPNGTALASRSIAVIDPVAFDNTQGMNGVVVADVTGTALQGLDRRLIARPMHLADTDGDNALEVIIPFAPNGVTDTNASAPTAQPVVMICRAGPSGMPAKCDDLVALAPDLGDAVCSDAAPIEARPRGRGAFDRPPADTSQNLIAVCNASGRSGLWRVWHDDAGYHAAQVLASTHGQIERVEVGDVTGDKIDDVLATIPSSGAAPNLIVIEQCPSGDLDDKGACK